MGQPNAERRVTGARELRLVGNPAHPRIEGYAAVFGELSEDLGGFVEKIEPGAFARTIGRDDVRALFNHDANKVLGRTKSGTLRLREDSRGLFFWVRPPDTTWASDVLKTIERGDVDQMSFGFNVVRDRWSQTEGLVTRTLLEVRLLDVSPVTFPAYSQTSAQVRAKAASLGRRWGASDLSPGRIDMMRKRIQLDRLEQSL